MNSIKLRQKTDGQVQVASVRVDKDVLLNDPHIKKRLKTEMENLMERNGIKVLRDVGVIEYD